MDSMPEAVMRAKLSLRHQDLLQDRVADLRSGVM